MTTDWVRHRDKIYISGPMTGIEGFNFPAFFEAEAAIFQVAPVPSTIFNPAREDCVRTGLRARVPILGERISTESALELSKTASQAETFDRRRVMSADLRFIVERATKVVVLPGWEASPGAQAEVAAARAVGVDVYTVEEYLAGGLPFDWDQFAVVSPRTSPDPGRGYANVFIGETLSKSGEVRKTAATGGQKGEKLAAFSQISYEVLWLVAEHFGKGARKYAAHNFRKQYPWHLSSDSLMRHFAKYMMGEEFDNHEANCPPDCLEHTESLHIIAVIWHAMGLAEFYLHPHPEHPEFDDRYIYSRGGVAHAKDATDDTEA